MLRVHGDAVPVGLPSGIRVWTVTRHDLAGRLLTDDRVSKDPRQHRTDWIEGRRQATWIRSWVDGMVE